MNVLFEDKYIIVVEKKAGVPSQRDYSNDISMVELIEEYLKINNRYYERIGLLHRLDRPVGGLMVFTKTYKSNKILSIDINNKTFLKEYLAVSCGKFETLEGIFIDYIIKNGRLNISKIVDKNTKFSKECKLEYKILKSINKGVDKFNLIKISLITGRHHQIRVQFANRQLGLIGDRKYNKGLKYNEKAPYIALWSYRIKFLHPISKKKIMITLKPHNYYPFNIKEFQSYY